MKKTLIALPLVALLAGCGQGSSGGGGGTDQIRVVGSSTVYPFTKAVAEQFGRAGNTPPIVESTGTGAGIKQFCSAVGQNSPDMVNASRPMKKSEYEACAKAGVRNVIEVPIGIDGLTLIQAAGSQPLNLTVEDVYAALAANPFGKGPNTTQTWKDVNPALPAVKIRVLGPPPTSGTRDSLVELYLTKGCESDPAMKELKKSDEDRHKDICTKVREDGAFVEAGENDNLLVQKVTADPGTLGVLGYSFLEENAERVQPVTIAGVAPTAKTISDLSYPGARKLYVYVKGEHMQVKSKLRDFVAQFAKMWSKGGPLERIGLVPLAAADAEAATTQSTELKPLDPSTLK